MFSCAFDCTTWQHEFEISLLKMLNSNVVKDLGFLCAFDCTTYSGNFIVRVGQPYQVQFCMETQFTSNKSNKSRQHDFKYVISVKMMFVLLLSVHIHTKQAEKYARPRRKLNVRPLECFVINAIMIIFKNHVDIEGTIDSVSKYHMLEPT